jgi:hypothetical protein
MKKNELSLWTLRYRKRYYLLHPWALFYDWYWNFRNFIHRGKYGFAYVDAWNWYYWWPKVGAECLRFLAEHGLGYPGYEPWGTPGQWKKYLEETARSLEWAIESCDTDTHNNEYNYIMEDIQKRCLITKTNEDGSITTKWEITPEEQEIKDKFWNREKELIEQDSKERERIFSEIGKNLPRFWD